MKRRCDTTCWPDQVAARNGLSYVNIAYFGTFTSHELCDRIVTIWQVHRYVVLIMIPGLGVVNGPSGLGVRLFST
jgi:hypothetical protein